MRNLLIQWILERDIYHRFTEEKLEQQTDTMLLTSLDMVVNDLCNDS